MRPYPEEILRAIQTGVMAHFAPEVESNYAKAQLAFAMLLFGVATRDYDTAVPDLLEGNKTLRGLLSDTDAALEGVAGDEASAARATIADLPPPGDSLRLSALRAERDALRGAVSALAALLEAAGDVEALAALRPSREAIYAHLSADAKKRVVPILSV